MSKLIDLMFTADIKLKYTLMSKLIYLIVYSRHQIKVYTDVQNNRPHVYSRHQIKVYTDVQTNRPHCLQQTSN